MPSHEEFWNDDCKRFIERIIKANKEIFVLSALIDKQMCGYDVIKEIFLKYNVLLGQGSVYPILYTLEEEGILQAEYIKGDMRSKNYCFTPKGREISQNEIEAFTNAMDRVRSLIEFELYV